MSPDSSDAQSEIREEIEKLETRWSENPKGRVFAHLADAYRKLQEFSKAENLILHGLKNHPNYISAYIVLGRIYTDSERYSDAHAQFTKVLEIDPQNLIALKFLGDLAIRGGRLEDARSWYERMLHVDPRNEEAKEALEALESGEPGAIAALQGEGKPAAASPEPEGGAGEETGEAAEMPAPSSGEVEMGTGEQELDVHTPAQSGYEMPGQPAEADASAVDAGGEGEAAPWDVGSDAIEEQTTAAMDEDPLDGLMTHDRSERAQTASDRASEASEFDEEDTMPWDRILDPEDLEPSAEGDVGQAGMAPQVPQGGHSGEGSGSSEELNLEDMDDWTPGFLRDEDLGERQMDDDELFAGLGEGEVSFDMVGQGEDSPDEESSDKGGGVVTETMAELYAEQGLFEDALRVYRRLLEARPDDERLKEKIRAIESKQAQDASISAAEVTADEGAETPGVPEAASDEPVAGERSDVAPAGLDVTPVAGLTSGAVSDFTPPDQDGEGEGEFEFEMRAPADDLAGADSFAGSMDAGFLKEPPETSADHSVEEVPVSEAPISEPQAPEPPAPAVEPEPAPAQAEPESVPDRALAGSAASGPASPATPSHEASDQAFSVVDESEGDERVETTIEEYLSKLLGHDSGASAQPAAASAQAGTAAPPESDSEEEGESGDSDPEDMAQFQEWLRSLKR